MNKASKKGVSHDIDEMSIELFINNLDFSLTNSQIEAIKEIAFDMSSSAPMKRLLQGDVGSGKTVVAAFALITAVLNQHQSALMAPTEVLAVQHYKTIVEMCKSLDIAL